MEFEVLNKFTKVCNGAHFPYRRSRASWNFWEFPEVLTSILLLLHKTEPKLCLLLWVDKEA